MFLFDLLNINKKCIHKRITPDLDFAYCPDCGKAIKNTWYITRCACCGLKLTSVGNNLEIHPSQKFCSNCGSQEYIVEKLDKLDIININYAVLVKEELEPSEKNKTITQCWQEKTNVQPKLLVQYL